MIIGYARVSTQEQLLDRQIDELKVAGCEKIFMEKVTGIKVKREELNNLINFARDGDVVIVTDLSRLSRSTKDLFFLISKFEDNNVNVKSLKENWLDTTTPQGKFLFTIFAGISQFERDLISQRTKEGLISAKARGRVGGRPKKSNEKKEVIFALYEKGFKKIDIARETNLSISTISKVIKTMSNCTEEVSNDKKL